MPELQSHPGPIDVLFWFIGTAVVSVWFVFRDPRFDYRFVIFGVLIPDVIDGLWGGARAFHAVTTSVAVMFIVMAATIGRRVWRKRLLGVPIGMFLHLIVDGAFDDTDVFWWPFTGVSFSQTRLPVVDRGVTNVVLEAIGLAVCVWMWRRFDLSDAGRRREFVREGRLTS